MADSNSLGKGQPTPTAGGGGVKDIGRAPTASTTNSNLQGPTGIGPSTFVALLSTEVLMSTFPLLTWPELTFLQMGLGEEFNL